jgi:cytochrome c-type biogenesis protein CcmH
MLWIWIFPVILLASFASVFYPIFSKTGNSPLPVGLEGDPLAPLTFERDMLLRQLKEISLDSDSAGEDDSIKIRLESDLAAVLVRLDELKKSLDSTTKSKKPARSQKPTNKGWAVSVMLLAALCSAGLYLVMGTPKVIPPTKAPAAASGPDIKAMVQQLAERMQKEPENRQGWMQLARSYGVLEQYDKAVTAYTHLLTLNPDDIDVAVALAGIQVRSGDAEQLSRGLQLFKDILGKDPDRKEALWFLGAMAMQVGERDIAIDKWQRLLKQLQPGTANYKSVEEAISQAKSE